MERIRITKQEYEDKLKLYHADNKYCSISENKSGKNRVLELRILKEFELTDID